MDDVDHIPQIYSHIKWYRQNANKIYIPSKPYIYVNFCKNTPFFFFPEIKCSEIFHYRSAAKTASILNLLRLPVLVQLVNIRKY